MTDRQQIGTAVAKVLVNATNYPRTVQVHILGQDMGPLIAMVTDAVMTEMDKHDE